MGGRLKVQFWGSFLYVYVRAFSGLERLQPFLSLVGVSAPDKIYLATNFRGWCRVWGEPGENRGGTGGEPGAPKRTGGEPGAFGKRTGGEPGLLVFIYKEYRGRSGGFGTRTGGEPGGGNFFETRDPTRDLKINEQDRP